jgi:biopolymer transport protein ExbD
MASLDPPPRRRIVFMLTPLVDVMFLLLIFFMLSSQTAPYSLLDIHAGGQPDAAQQPGASAPAQPPVPAGKGDVVVSIANGYVRFNGERVEMADLAGAIARYKAAGFASAVVFSTQAATVQDMVTVIETFEGSGFGEMRLVTRSVSP